MALPPQHYSSLLVRAWPSFCGSSSLVSNDDFAGNDNPHYVLYCDYYGDVYAKYVGPYDGDVALSIWVPKTLVANKRGPIESWVPKSKP